MNCKLLFIPLAFLALSCGSSKKMATLPADNSYNIQYALPETEIRFEFTLVREIFIPGPFAEYADKYLSLENVRKAEETTWDVIDIQTQTIKTPADNKIYSLENVQSPIFERYLDFSTHGLVTSPYKQISDSGNFHFTPYNENQIHFTDLGVKRNFDKVRRQEAVRSNNFPYHGSMIDKKEQEAKAEEAANFIIKARKRRFKLLAGQYDFLPEGNALAISVEELNKIEAEYTSLFTGKTYTDTIKFVTYHYPEEQVKEEFSNIAYFSESEGMSSEWIQNSLPVEMKLNNLSYIETFSTRPNIPGALYYRAPAKARLTLRLNNKAIFEQRIEVYQYAPIKTFGFFNED